MQLWNCCNCSSSCLRSNTGCWWFCVFNGLSLEQKPSLPPLHLHLRIRWGPEIGSHCRDSMGFYLVYSTWIQCFQVWVTSCLSQSHCQIFRFSSRDNDVWQLLEVHVATSTMFFEFKPQLWESKPAAHQYIIYNYAIWCTSTLCHNHADYLK